MKSLLPITACDFCKKRAEFLYLELEVIPNFGVKNNWNFLCQVHAIKMSNEKKVIVSERRSKHEKDDETEKEYFGK